MFRVLEFNKMICEPIRMKFFKSMEAADAYVEKNISELLLSGFEVGEVSGYLDGLPR